MLNDVKLKWEGLIKDTPTHIKFFLPSGVDSESREDAVSVEGTTIQEGALKSFPRLEGLEGIDNGLNNL